MIRDGSDLQLIGRAIRDRWPTTAGQLKNIEAELIQIRDAGQVEGRPLKPRFATRLDKTLKLIQARLATLEREGVVHAI